MLWAVVYHPEQITADGIPMQPPLQIAEHCLPAAIAQGWVLLGTDSTVMTDTVDVPLQSNPRRVITPGEDAW